NPTVNFHGERRSNATHASTTDPQALLYRKGARREAKLCYQGHVLMENRHGLAVDGCLTPGSADDFPLTSLGDETGRGLAIRDGRRSTSSLGSPNPGEAPGRSLAARQLPESQGKSWRRRDMRCLRGDH